jgi:hypothetical protein
MRDDVFFENTPKKILDFKGEPAEFPALYYDFRFVNCIFTAKIDRLKQILPHPQFKPIPIWPGTGLLTVCFFEYRDSAIGPYNEVAINVPINFAPDSILSKTSALSSLRKNVFSIYILHLPVTTEIARDRGIYFFNYPKFLAEIECVEQDGSLEITLKEKEELILKMTANRLPLESSDTIEMHTFSLDEKKIMHSLVEVYASKFGKKTLGRCGELELGSHRISEELKGLKLSKSAWSGFCGDGTMAKLYDPDRFWDKETLQPLSKT